MISGRARIITLLWIVLAACALAFAAGRVECSSVKSARIGTAIPYCAFLPPSYESKKTSKFHVLYMLHGLGDNHESLINTGTWNMVEGLQEQKKIGEFVIITPSAARTFYVNSKNGKVAYEDFFIKEFIPAMEKRYHIRRDRGGRGISGMSMGGYGALRFAFKYPQMFVAVSAHSAALLERMPKGAEFAGLGSYLGSSFGVPFDPNYWERSTPFFYARTVSPNGLKIYFDCGKQDDYGFEVGTESLHRLLVARKIAHEYHIYPGTHGWSYFAAHLGESLEFQSRAFGLTK